MKLWIFATTLPEIKPVDELIELVINPSYLEQKIKLGSQLTTEERDDIITLLKHNLDIFAWKVEDMKGIREYVAIHRLGVNPAIKFKEQRLRIFSTEKEVAIKQEIEKLLSAGIIVDAGFTTWLANVVLVKKPNGK